MTDLSTEEMVEAVEWAAMVAKAVGFNSRHRNLTKIAKGLAATRAEGGLQVALTGPKAEPSVFTKADCDALYQAWVAAYGATNYAMFRKSFLPLYEQERGALHPLDQLLQAVKWSGALLKERPRDLQFMTPERFAGKIAFWLEVLDWPAAERFSRFGDAMSNRVHGAR